MTIIDCVPYYKEADILALRLAQLDPVVDLFVVVEGDHTHRGDPKPSHFPDELRRRWGHKLHVHTAALPPHVPGDAVWTWRREIAQRNAIGEALAYLRCAPDDMILVSDCDEIPRRSFVAMLPALPADGIAVALSRLHYYTFNHVAGGATWFGTRATQYANVQALSPDGVRYVNRERGGYPRLYHIPDAGWHLSYFGGPAYVREKIGAFLHQEFNLPEHVDEATIVSRIAAGDDIYGRPEQTFTIGPAHDLPDAVYEQPGRWLRHFHPDHAPHFTEDWMADGQCQLLATLAAHAPADGLCVEIGAWEGKSTIAIAAALGTRPLEAVDTWAGNVDEGDDHPSVTAARARDVAAQFLANLRAFGLTNVRPVRADWRAWAQQSDAPIAFCHLDAAHDLGTVAAQFDAILPRLVDGAILCGDDYFADGVRTMVERLPGYATNGKLWYWRRPA